MIKRFIIIAFLILISIPGFSQELYKPFKANTAFLEIGGAGQASLNFEHAFKLTNWLNLSCRAGAGIGTFLEKNPVVFPVQLKTTIVTYAVSLELGCSLVTWIINSSKMEYLIDDKGMYSDYFGLGYLGIRMNFFNDTVYFLRRIHSVSLQKAVRITR